MLGWLKRKHQERAIVLPAVGKRFRYGGTKLYVHEIRWDFNGGTTVTLRSESPDFYVERCSGVTVEGAPDQDGSSRD